MNRLILKISIYLMFDIVYGYTGINKDCGLEMALFCLCIVNFFLLCVIIYIIAISCSNCFVITPRLKNSLKTKISTDTFSSVSISMDNISLGTISFSSSKYINSFEEEMVEEEMVEEETIAIF